MNRTAIIFVSFVICMTACASQESGKKISVIIPCGPKHAGFLFELISLYEHQTRLPDEIVVSLSEVGTVSAECMKKIGESSWVFPVKLVVTNRVCWASVNRNRACSAAQGDIFVCQDADDLPHPQRLEMIYHFFKNYKIALLLHGFTILSRNEPLGTLPTYDPKKLTALFLQKHYPNLDPALLKELHLHLGNSAIAREVFDRVKWPEGMRRSEDAAFNEMVWHAFHNILTVREPLLLYRPELSTDSNYTYFDKPTQFIPQATMNLSKKYRTIFVHQD